MTQPKHEFFTGTRPCKILAQSTTIAMRHPLGNILTISTIFLKRRRYDKHLHYVYIGWGKYDHIDGSYMRNFECKIFHSPQTHSQIIINKPGTRERWLEKGDVVMFDDRFVHKSIIVISWSRSTKFNPLNI